MSYRRDVDRAGGRRVCSTTTSIPDDVDSKIGQPGYVGMTISGPRSRRTSNITDARQRWLFRMVHTKRPLQEKMTLFWHNHFATGYTKIAGALGADRSDALSGGEAVRGSGRRARPDRDAARQRARQLPRHPGQHRQGHGDAGLARRPHQHEGAARRRTSAARSWSCSRWASATTPSPTSTRRRACSPAGTWRGPARPATARSTTSSSIYPAQHDTAAKTFSFPIYPDGGKTIPARAAADGMQDGLDFINGAGRASRTPARYLATKLYRFFVVGVGRRRRRRSSTASPPSTCRAGYDMKAVMREVLLSPRVLGRRAPTSRATRGRSSSSCASIKDVGWTRLLGRRRADAAVEHGTEPLRAARRGGLGSRPVVVFDRRDAGADELRLDARRQSAVQPGDGGQAAHAQTPEALLAFVLEALSTAPLDAVGHRRARRTICARPARGPAATRSCRRRSPGSCTSMAGSAGVPARMKVTRRQFVKGGVAAFTVTFAAPEFLSDLARAQGARVRNLVVLYLSGGNDALSMLMPVQRSVLLPAAGRRSPSRPAACCRSAPTRRASRSACIRGSPGSSRSSIRAASRSSSAPATRTRAARISTAPTSGRPPIRATRPALGWVGRYLDSLPSPVDPLVGWNTTARSAARAAGQHTCRCRRFRARPATRSPARTPAPKRPPSAPPRCASPRTCRSIGRSWRSSTAARRRRWPRSIASRPSPPTTAPSTLSRNNGFAQALKAVAGAMVRGIGTRVFYVTTGGFDTHSAQNVERGQRHLLQPDGDA